MESCKRVFLLLAFAGIAAWSGCGRDGGKRITPPAPEPPEITALIPDSAAVGDTVDVLGLRFGADRGASQVLFGTIDAAAPSWSDSRIRAIVPDGAATGAVQVVVDGRRSNGKAFEVAAPPPPPEAPEIDALIPDHGASGDTILVRGRRFGQSRGTSMILFGPLDAVSPAWSDSVIRAIVPAGAQTAAVRVIVGAAESNGKPFEVIVPPTMAIERLVPVRTVVADTITVVGSGFGAAQESGALTFAGTGDARIEAAVISWSGTEIVGIVPPGAVDGPILVTKGSAVSDPHEFSVAERLISYRDDLVPLFTRKGCADCHGGTNNLFLDSPEAVLRGNSAHGPVVVRRNGEGSILFLKVTANPPFGSRMPLGCGGQVCVSSEDARMVSDWIDQGTRDN